MTSAHYQPAANGVAEPCVHSSKSARESETDVKPLNNKYVGKILASCRSSILRIFGETTSHPTGSVETRSPLEDAIEEKQPPYRTKCYERWL